MDKVIIDKPGSYRTREGKRAEVVPNPHGSHPWQEASRDTECGMIRVWSRAGKRFDTGTTDHPTDIIGPWTEPTRLSLAKAALEEAQAVHSRCVAECSDATTRRDYASERVMWAREEVRAAESEAAQLAAIPPALLEVARKFTEKYGKDCCSMHVLATAYGIDPAVLRAAMGAKP